MIKESMIAGMKISFIIPCYNEEGNIEECVETLLNQTEPIDEIVIVDDASTDGTRTVLKKIKNKKIKVIFNNKNMGRPFSINQGLKIADGNIIGIIDADCRPDGKWLERGLKKLTDAEVVSGPYIVPPNRNPIQIGHQIVNDFFSTKGQSNLVTGGNLITRKEKLVEVGGFDERSPYGEDYNLSRKLNNIGAKIYYGPDMGIVSTGEPKTVEEIIRQRLTQGSTLRHSFKEYGLSVGTVTRFLYVITFLGGFVFHLLWIITSIPMIVLLLYGLKHKQKYSYSGVLIAPFVGLLRTTTTFFGFLIGSPKKWRQKEL